MKAILGLLLGFSMSAFATLSDPCTTTNQPCGNTTPLPCCPRPCCTNDFPEGTLACAGVSSYNAYPGNGARWNSDTAVANVPSSLGLEFTRMGTTRPNLSSELFGNLGIWRHNWQWGIRPVTATMLEIDFPAGYKSWYTLTATPGPLTNAVYAGATRVFRGPGYMTDAVIERPDGNELCLLQQDGTRWFFLKYLLWGNTRYQLDRALDPVGRQTTFFYDGSRRMVRIQEPAGRYIALSYQALTVNQGQFYTGLTIASAPGTNGWTQYTLATPATRRYWRLRAADGERLPVAELRFLDSAGNEWTGTPIGSPALAPGYEPGNAFDNNDLTFYYSSDVTGGYVGLDLGANRAVTAIKLKPLPGEEGLLVGAAVESATIAPVTLGLIRFADTSDGRRQTYEYTQAQDPNLPAMGYVLLSRVIYDDASEANYAYEQVLPSTRPLLQEANEARVLGHVPHIAYTYHTGDNNVMGQIRQEIDPVDGNVLSCLTTADQPHKPKVVYPGGREVTFVMGSQVSQKTDSLGRTTHYVHDGQWGGGYLLSKTDPAGRTTTYARDHMGRVLTETLPDTSVREYAYDLLGRLLTQTDELGRTTTHTRDALGQVTRTDYADNTFETFAYNALGLVTSHLRTHGGTVAHQYDALGLETAMTDELGHVTSYSNYPSGLPATQTDPRGYVTRYHYDTSGRRTGVNYADGGTESWEYDSRGNLVLHTDPQGGETLFVYDQFNRKVAQIDPLDRQTSWSYDNLGTGCGCSGLDKPTQMISAGLKVTRFDYDAAWQLTSRTEAWGTPQAATTSFAYDAAGNRIRQTDPDGHATHFTFDVRNRIASVSNALGQVTSYAYDEVGNRLTETVADGGTRHFTYDTMNRLVESRDPLNNTVVNGYNTLGQLVSVTDARGFATRFEYNARNERVKTTFPGGAFTLASYDAVGNVLTHTDELGNLSSNVYDHASRLVAAVDPLGRSTQYDYPLGKRGVQLAVTRPSGRRVEYAYDLAWQRVAQVQAPGTAEEAVTRWLYDADGNTVATVDPLSHTNVFAFDALNRRVAATDPLGHTTTFVYDPTGNLLRTVRADGTGTTNAYDAVNRLIAVTDAKSQTTQYGYDAVGRMTSLTDANANVTQWTYDLAGRLTAKTYADSSQVTYSYDAGGNLTQAVWPTGVTRSYAYDNRSRLLEVVYSDATPDVAFTYDAAGRLTAKSSSVAGFAYTYDAAGQLTGEVQTLAGHPGGAQTIGYGHDADGNRVSTVYPDGTTVGYGYTGRGQLAGVTLVGQPLADYTHDLAGRLTEVARANGTSTENTWDAANRFLQTVHVDPAQAVLDSVAYGYDVVNRRTWAKYADDIGDRFGYDAIDQVVDVQYDLPNPDQGGTSTNYETTVYDPLGNRLQLTQDGGQTVYLPNELNQYAEIDSTALTYDLNGNLTADNVSKLYTWDAENRLLCVAPASPTNGSLKVEYAYDAGSRRVKSARSIWDAASQQYQVSSISFFVYDQWNVIAEATESSNLQSTNRYVWGQDLSGTLQGAGGIGGLLATVRSGDPEPVEGFHHHDGNGNVILLSDAAGASAASYRYAAFGATRRAAGALAAVNTYRFSTKPVEESVGLYYYGYRHYSPPFGRWLNRDPVGVFGGVNPYVFALNYPDRSDYLGLWSTKKCCNGQIYSTLDYCCCCDGEVKLDGGTGCALRPKQGISTGVKLCSETSGSIKDRHGWVEFDGFAIGFYPSGSPFGSPAYIHVMDPAARMPKHCEDYRLNPCEYDIQKFKDAMLKKAGGDNILCPPVKSGPTCPYRYFWPFSTCLTYRGDLIRYGKSEAKGSCTMP